MSIFRKLLLWLDDATYVWRQELKHVFRDEGVLMFCIVVPLGYPLLYSWIYNNETVHEVPVVVVDQSRSQLSRAVDLDDAKSLVSRQVVKGIYYIPEDFATRLNRMEQSTISVYCDMALMLTYKAIYQTALSVTTQMGVAIKRSVMGNYTARDDLVATSPLQIEEVAVFNPAGGYGSSVIPAVLMLIIQQTLALGVGMAAGTSRERSRYSDLIPINRCYSSVGRIICGKSMCYLMIYAVMSTYLAVVVPRMFNYIHMAPLSSLVVLMIPYLLRVVALPQHLRHQGLYPPELHGRHAGRCLL